MADESVGNFVQIGKFNGKNYQQWKFQIKCALRAKGVLEIATGTAIKPEEAEAINLKKWNKQDAIAMCILSSSMELTLISLIENCMSANEILKKLDSIYEMKSETNKMLAHENFYQYKMNPSDSVAQHISKVENLARQIADTGDTISDTAVITKILGSLPPKYWSIRQAWLSLEESKQTITNLTARLLDEERNLGSQIETQTALATSISNSSQQNKTKSYKSKVTCYNCERKGHFARDCRLPKKENRSRCNNKQSTAFNTELETFTNEHNEEEKWIMDSGASQHMCPHLNYFSSINETSDLFVKLGNNEKLQVKGIGIIEIQKWINGKWIDGKIENVWFIPDLKRNLFSEGVITRKGFSIVKGNEHANIYENNLLIASALRDENNLYNLQIRVKFPKAEANSVSVGSLQTWHERLGHLNKKSLKELFSKNLIDGVKLCESDDFFCEGCVYGKQHRLKFEPREKLENKPGEFIFSDVCGPMSTESIGGSRYFILFKDDSTGYREVKFLKHKSDVYDRFSDFIKMCKTKFGYNIKRVRVDNGTEFINKRMSNLFSENGIILETTGIYTPEQNGRCERDNRTIVENARSMLYTKDLPLELWAEAVNTAVYLLNRTPTKQVKSSTPFEKWTGRKPNLQHVKVFGCEAYLHVPDNLRKKLERKSRKFMLVGYDGESTNYRLYDPHTKEIKVSRNVIFNEASKVNIPRINTILINLNEDNDSEKVIEKETREEKSEDLSDVMQENNQSTQQQQEYNLRSRRNIKPPDYLTNFELNLTECYVPTTYEEAVKGENSLKWKEAITEELQALEDNNTWEIMKLPPKKTTIGSRWVFRIKETPGKDIRFKARLCAKGCSQTKGVNYNETFAPTTRYDTIRVLLSVAVQKQLKILQFDVKTAFLHGELEEEVFMLPPEGTSISKDTVCKLKRSLYGLKQSPRCWNKKFNQFLKSYDFKQCEADKCVYVSNKTKDSETILVLYVDDGLIMTSDINDLNDFIEDLKIKFQATVFDVSYFVGLEIIQKPNSIFIHLNSYIKNMLSKLNLSEIKPSDTPVDPNTVLVRDMDSEQFDEYKYRQAVGCLTFATVTVRPDIAYAVNLVSRFQHCATKTHWNAILRIFRYLKHTSNFGIEYVYKPELNGYSDADFGGDRDTRRSTSGYVFLYGQGAVTWASRRQTSVALSTTESEYVAASLATKELIWLRQLFSEVNVNTDTSTIFIDNQSAIKLIQNPVFHKRTKHIEIHYHFIREKYEQGMLNVEYVATEKQIADIFTKALTHLKFEKFRMLMNMNHVV